MGLVYCLLGSTSTILGASIVSARLLPRSPGWPRFFAGFLLAWVWTTLGMLVLGNFGAIHRPAVLGWSIAGGLAALPFLRRSERNSAPQVPTESFGVEVTIAGGLTAWVFAYLAARSYLYPVKVVSDGPIYHLYFAARWWMAGGLSPVATPFGETAAPYFPHVGELVMTWLFALAGGDGFARLAQVPFLVVASLACYASSRELSLGRAASALAALIFATLTPLVLFTFEPNVDTIFIAAYLVSVYFFLRSFRGGDERVSLVLGSVAAGAAWGVKPTGVVFIPVLLALVVVAIFTRRRPIREKLKELGLVVAGTLAMEGYWPARNAFWTGNPLYPLHLKIGGVVLLHGWYGPEAMPSSHYYLPMKLWGAMGDMLLSVVDPRLAPLWLAATAAAFLPCGPKGNRRWVRLFALGAVVNVALFWLVIPYRTQQRFLLHAMGLGAVPLAALLNRSLVARWIAVGLLALHLTTPQGWPFPTIPWDLSPVVPNTSPAPTPLPWNAVADPRHRVDPLWLGASALLGACGFIPAWAWTWWGRRSGRSRLATAVGASVLYLSGVFGLIAFDAPAGRAQKYPPFRDYYAAWLRLDALTARRPATIAYAGTNIPFYLMGPEFRNSVRYVNIDEHDGDLLHDYHRRASALGQPDPWPDTRPLWDRLRPDFDAWLRNLRRAKVDYVVVARANPQEGARNVADSEGFTLEKVWSESHPDLFAPVYGVTEGDPFMRIYRLKPTVERENGRASTDSAASPH